MKKLFKMSVLIAALGLALSFAGCSNPASDNDAIEKETVVPEATTPAEEEVTTPPADEEVPPPAEPTDLEIPLTLEAITDGELGVYGPWSTFKYKKNDGDFQTVTPTITNGYSEAYISVVAGDKISLYADGSENDDNDETTIMHFKGDDTEFYIYGNIMSLLDSVNFSTKTDITTPCAFEFMFYDNDVYLKSHPEKNLMLPATTLSDGCYGYMFSGCTKISKAPELPATTLAQSCYVSMFNDCFCLEKAPVLPAVTLVKKCYKEMFSGCEKLNYVKCLATDLSATDCTKDWLEDVSDSGTFVKAEGANWSTGNSGIPENWTEPGTAKVVLSTFANGTVTSDNEIVIPGETVTLTITPSAGYELDTLSVISGTEEVTLSGEGNTRTFTMPEENVTVSATFKAIDYAITIGTFQHGKVTASKQVAHVGDQITLGVTPDSGYSLKILKKDGVELPAPGSLATFTMPASNVNITAEFQAINYSITTNNIQNGTVTPSKTTAHIGDSITVSIAPSEGYTVSSVKMNGSDITVSNNQATFQMPAKDVTITASFTAINYSISCGSFTNGNVTASKTTAHFKDPITLTVSAANGYELESLTMNGTALSVSNNKATFTMPAANVNVNATFKQINYTITKNAIYNGIIEVAQSATYGQTVTITVKPNIAYELQTLTVNNGEVSVTGEGNIRTFIMPAGAVTIAASFVKTHLGTKDKPNAVGDIVFNDGTATPYSADLSLTDQQKAAAIAVIFRSDINAVAGVGLKETNTFFCKEGTQGWERQSQLDERNGFNNSLIHIAQGFSDYSDENYPAAWWANNYTGSGNLGEYNEASWYLPAVYEYKIMYNNLSTVSAALALIGNEYADSINTATANSDAYISSSQELRDDNSYPDWIKVFKFGTGDYYLAKKDYTRGVRAIMRF